MKKKVMEFNLAELTQEKLIDVLETNNAGLGELIALLEALFDMFSSSLKFSGTVIEYAEARHPNFLEAFVKETASNHGIAPQQLASIVNTIREAKAQAQAEQSTLH